MAHVGDDAHDGALAVDAVVVGHVGCQGVDVEHAVQLQTGVRLLGLVGVDGILLHVQRVLQCVLHRTHPQPLPIKEGSRYSTIGGFKF